MGRKVSEQEYLERMKKQHPNIEVLGKYVNFKTKVALRCKKDGYEWEATPNKSLNCNCGCPKCGGSLPLTHNDFVNQMKEINSNIEFESTYVNDCTKIKCHCLICDNRWKNTLTHLKIGEDCPICSKLRCSKNLARTMKDFKEQLKQINNNIKILSKKYINGKTKVKCECLTCGHKWEATPDNLLRGKDCPKCYKTSKGERKIINWLDNNKINYEIQYTFNNCRDKRVLPFDIYIVDYNFLIEYDGEQHFFPVQFAGMSLERNVIQYLNTLKRDSIKNKYCKDNNIFLLRIPYWHLNNIENILEKLFKNL